MRTHVLRLVSLQSGRLFDQHVLDMVELGVEEYIGIEDFNSKTNPGAGVKPVFIFNGALFETNEDYKVFANIIVGTEAALLVNVSLS